MIHKGGHEGRDAPSLLCQSLNIGKVKENHLLKAKKANVKGTETTFIFLLHASYNIESYASSFMGIGRYI